MNPLTQTTPHLRRATALAPMFVSAATTLLLYGASLHYGFMYDDGMDLPRATDRTFIAIFTSAGDSSYYRPIVLALWKIIHLALGRNDAFVLHLLVITIHAFNGWLVYQLARRLHGSLGGYVSSLLFITFPFSYQAVGKINAFFHPLVTAFLLAAVLTYWLWRERQSYFWLALALLSAGLAVFTHEYGIAVAALVPLVEALWLASQRCRRPSRSVLWFFAMAASFVTIWSLIPKRQFQWTFDPTSIALNGRYFLQGVLYPVSSSLQGLVTDNGLVVAGAVWLMLVVILHAGARRIVSLFFGVAWIVVASSPAIVTLPFSYVVDGPRLLYPASVGVALLWGGFLAAPLRWQGKVAAILGGLPAVAAASLIVFQATLFVQARGVLYDHGARLVRDLVATAGDPVRPGRTYVNLPSWLTLKSSDYAIGHSGVTMIPSYIGLGRVVYVHTHDQPAIASLGYDVTRRGWVYHYEPHGPPVGLDDLEGAFRKGGAVYYTVFGENRLALEYAGQIARQNRGDAISPFFASFGDWASLLRAQARLDGNVVDIDLSWQALKAIARDYTVFVHIAGPDGKPVAQADGYAIAAMFPLERWRPGDLIDDHRRVSLPQYVAPGSYTVLVGVYDRADGQRAPAGDGAGVRWPNDAVVIGHIAIP